MFGWRKKVSFDAAARHCMALAQVCLVQPAAEQAEQEAKDLSEVRTLAVFHAVACLFLKIEQLVELGEITKEAALHLKQSLLQANLHFSYRKEELTQQKADMFTEYVYELLRQLGCNGQSTNDQLLGAVLRSFCGMTELTEHGQLLHGLTLLSDKTEQYLYKASFSSV